MSVRQPTIFMCRLSRNLGALTSWNPVGLFRPVMGQLYLFYVSTATLQHKNRIRDIFHTKQVHQALHSFLQEKSRAHTIK